MLYHYSNLLHNIQLLVVKLQLLDVVIVLHIFAEHEKTHELLQPLFQKLSMKMDF